MSADSPPRDSAAPASFAFGDFRLDLATRSLRRGGEHVALQDRPFDVLAYLVAEAPRLVTRDELLARFWRRAVNDEVLTRCISTIRKTLADNDDTPRFIETRRAQGYRFLAPVRRQMDTTQPTEQATGRRRPIALAATLALLAAISGFVATRPAVPPVSVPVERVAVLPLALGVDAEPWLAPALTDEFMRVVSRIEGITVVAAAGTGSDPLHLDRRLKVDAALTARLDPAGDGSTLSARLVAVPGGALLWSANFDSAQPLSSRQQIEALAREMALRLRPRLQLQAVPAEVDPAAYRHYLQGRYYWSQRGAAQLEAAIDAFAAALALEPQYVDALVGAADAWLQLPLYGARVPSSAIPQAQALAREALTLDRDNARARAILGVIAMQYEWNWHDAESLLREAVALGPNDATARQWLAELYCYRQRFSDCAREFAVARDLDPLSPVLAMQEGSVYLYQGDYAAAKRVFASVAETYPSYAFSRYVMGHARVGLGEWDGAVAAYDASLPTLGLEIVGGPLVFALAKSGETERARAVFAELQALAAARYVPPTKIAIGHLGLGERQQALAALQAALAVHDDRLVYLAVDVHTRGIADDPAFSAVFEQLGF